MMKSALYSWTSLLLLPAVFGLPGWPTGGTIVAGDAVLFDREHWEANLAHPNATGNNSVIGFDVSKPWPSKQVDGWHLSINATRDIPGSETMNPSNATGKAFTGTSIFLQAGDDLHSAFDDPAAVNETTWKICVVVIPDVPQDNTTAPAENGTCAMLAPQCVSDLEKAYKDKFARGQDCYGSPPPTPASCGDKVNTGRFNVQQLPLDSIRGREIYVTASEPHDPSDDAQPWSEATSKIWPVLTIWGWNARANASSDAMPTVQLSCISARDEAPPSDSEPPSSLAARRRCGKAGAALLGAGVAAFVML
ncbi:hypothetical protein F4777DRAFT_553936 [Nemania sp. FL0916]|nr:hypothetical protein F4777DRAFT_553936 [Nemania sp. FL0916]